jgi:hypothetical protein
MKKIQFTSNLLIQESSGFILSVGIFIASGSTETERHQEA